jgi:D-3-phosphoglycerate dehydrogenase
MDINTSYPKDKLNILLLENISAEAVNSFRQKGYDRIVTHKGALSEEELLEAIPEVHILGIRSKTQITRGVLEAAQKLLGIGCFCIGTNQVDMPGARQKGVAVFNSPYSNTRSVAELVIGAAIMLIRKIPDKNRMAHEGVWMKESSNSRELRGKTLGIIGYGNIGSQVSVLAEGMGMKVVFYDLQKKLPLGNAQVVGSIEEVMKAADVLTIHTPADKTTHNLINKERLKLCRNGAVVINYARGEVTDTDALKDALESGKLSGVAIDVYKEEPEKNGDAFSCALQGMPNVLLTPHIGGSTEEAQVNIGMDVSDKLLQYLETGSSLGSHSVPALSLPMQEEAHRILHIHENIPGVLFEINKTMSDNGINILGQYLKTNEEIGYVVLDINKELSGNATGLLRKIKGTIKTRLLY